MKISILFSAFVILITCCCSSTVWSQTAQKPPFKAVSVPKENNLPVIAYQPDCPLKLFHVDVRAYLDGGEKTILKYRNEGDKPIISYTIAAITTFGTGKEYILGNLPKSRMIMPGEEIVLGNPHLDRLVESTDDIRSSLHLENAMQSLTILLVARIEFADGTIFEDEQLYKCLKTFMNKLSNTSLNK